VQRASEGPAVLASPLGNLGSPLFAACVGTERPVIFWGQQHRNRTVQSGVYLPECEPESARKLFLCGQSAPVQTVVRAQQLRLFWRESRELESAERCQPGGERATLAARPFAQSIGTSDQTLVLALAFGG
jgi:hypothetical protein